MRNPLTIEGRRFRCADVDIEATALELCGAREDWSNSTPVYRLDALGPGGARATLLEGPDPAPVLAQARELSHACGLPLSGTWGNGMGQSPRPRASLPEVAVKSTVGVSQRSAGWTSLGSTIFVLLFYLDAGEHQARPRARRRCPSSLILPLPAVTLGFAISLWLPRAEGPGRLRSSRRARLLTLSLWAPPRGGDTSGAASCSTSKPSPLTEGSRFTCWSNPAEGCELGRWWEPRPPSWRTHFSAGATWIDQSTDLHDSVEKISGSCSSARSRSRLSDTPPCWDLGPGSTVDRAR